MKEIFKKLDDIINHQEMLLFIGGNIKKDFEKAIDIIKKHIEDDGKDILESDIAIVKDTTTLLIALLAEREVKKNIEKWFVQRYAELVFNWNENYIKDDQINSHLNYALNYTNNCMTLHQMMSMLRRVTSRLESFSKSDVPTFKLSDHYFNIIKEEK